MVRGTFLGRLQVTAEVDAFFPDLAPGQGNGKAGTPGNEEAPKEPAKPTMTVAA